MRRGWMVLFGMALTVIGGCGSDDAADDPTQEGAEVSSGAEGIPAVRAVADAAEFCAAGFVEELSAGQNTCYEVADQNRNFYLALPEGIDEGPKPLLVAFNGTGGTGEGFFNDVKLQDYVDAGFIVLAPSSIGNGTVFPVWDAMHALNDTEYPNPDLDFVDSVVGCVQAHYGVDSNRMYVTGHSAGGIMANYVLQRRSDIYAGGVVASGIISLTKPEEVENLSPMAVVVTWGGDNDEWSGDSDGSGGGDGDGEGETQSCGEPEAEGGEEGEESQAVSVPSISFVEQAAIASSTYEGVEGGNQIWCKGNELGHEYLTEGNPYFIDFLLAHPKGLTVNPEWSFSAPGDGYPMQCQDGVYSLPEDDKLRCAGDSGCAAFCDATSVCGLSNATVSGVLAPQLEELGLTADSEDCGDCIARCEDIFKSDLAHSSDDDVLACLATNSPEAGPFCGPGIDGVYPYVDLMNGCCAGKTDSAFCGFYCDIINTNSAAQTFFTECAAWSVEETE